METLGGRSQSTLFPINAQFLQHNMALNMALNMASKLYAMFFAAMHLL